MNEFIVGFVKLVEIDICILWCVLFDKICEFFVIVCCVIFFDCLIFFVFVLIMD